jgi:hypothetical protein
MLILGDDNPNNLIGTVDDDVIRGFGGAKAATI